jgi:arsenate reductase
VIKPKVLFLCGANSCRTQMAEGFLRDLAGDRFEVMSPGYEPSEEVCHDAIEAMREVGIDISGQRPKKTDDFLGQRIGYVVTLCDRQKERSCPIFPGAIWRITWPLEDPLVTTAPSERQAAVRHARDEIRRRVVEFVSENA